MASRKHAILIAALLSSAAVLAACGGGSTKNADSSSSASQASIDDLSARVQRDEMLNAWVTVSNMPLHDLDQTLQGGTIDGKYVPTLRTLIRVLALTSWTSDVQPLTTKMHDDAVALLQVLEAGKEPGALKDLSSALHDDSHGFGTNIGNAVAKDLPANAGGPLPTSAATTTTPAAAATAVRTP